MRGNLKCYYQFPSSDPLVPATTFIDDANFGQVTCDASTQPSNSIASSSFTLHRAISQFFGTTEEILALQVYNHKIAPFTSIYFKNPHLWTVVLPCVSWQEPTVKHALVAVTIADMNMTNGIVSPDYGIRASYHYHAAI